jgi:transposase-like protein
MIIEVVGLYYHFPLSYRDCAKIMRQFRISVHHTKIKGIEVISVLYKESRREITLFDFSPWEEIEHLLKTA